LHFAQHAKIFSTILWLCLSVSSEAAAGEKWAGFPLIFHWSTVVIPDHLEEKRRVFPPFPAAMAFEMSLKRQFGATMAKTTCYHIANRDDLLN
jgi:hypothetical protein